jgi:hypothetical protein
MCFLEGVLFSNEAQKSAFSCLFEYYARVYIIKRICYFGECSETFQVLFLNRRDHEINFVCHLCLEEIGDVSD